jgi:hypothetical protein
VAIFKWCPGPELNRYVSFETRDFKSRASASFATRAGRKGFEVNISVDRRKVSERCRVHTEIDLVLTLFLVGPPSPP